jgi:small conductance mechanosensitive channel
MNKQNVIFARKFTLWVVLSLFAVARIHAQVPEEAPAPEAESAKADAAKTTTNPDVVIEELKLRLKPLTHDELVIEANAWQKLVQQKVAEISTAEIAGLRVEGDDSKEKIGQANTLREARTALIDRQKAVLTALRDKGGTDEEIAPYNQYLQSVSGLVINAKKPGTAFTVIQGWLVSKEGGVRWGANLIKFLLVVIVAWMIAGVVARIMRKVTSKTKFSALLENFIVNTSRNLVKIFGLIIGLSMLEVDIGPLLAGVGVLGFVVGFALQDTLGNFAAGFMILLYRPYDVGDFVTAGGVTGTVVAMSLVSTTFKTPDNQKVIMPNGKIWGDTITNTTGNKTRRIDLVIGCGYDDDLAKVQSILEEVVSAQEGLLKEPEAFVGVSELADSSVNFFVRPWVNTGDYGVIRSALIRAIKERFDAEGINIPYPTRQLYLTKEG